MGNTIYHSECKFAFSLDHDQVGNNSLALVAGSPLRGRVTFVAKKDLPPTKIMLRLTGKEKTKVVVRHGKTHSTYRGERNLCRTSITLQELSQAPIARGTYNFPFEFPMSQALPSSMDCANGDDNCTVVYKLKIDIVPNGKKMVPGVAVRFFTVASTPLPPTAIPATIAPKAIRVESFGFDRGYIAMAARILDVHVGRGTHLELYLACKNDASASIYRVEVALLETTSWVAEGRRKQSTRNMILVNDLDLPSILRGKQDSKDVKRIIKSRGTSQEDLACLVQDLQSRRSCVKIKIPQTTRDTCNNQLIGVTHTLKITTFTKTNISNPSICVPLRIGYPPMAQAPRSEETAAYRPRASAAEAVAVAVEEKIPRPRPGLTPQYSVPNLPDTTIPIVEACIIPVDDQTIQAPMATAPMEATDLGGFATFTITENDDESDKAPAMANAKILSSGGAPSLEALKEEMMYSIDDYAILRHKLETHEWRVLLSSISPEELGTLVTLVNRDTHQPQVVELIAKKALKELFTCEFGRAAVQKAEEWVRPTMVEKVLPLCVDADTNFSLIQDSLSDWDRALTEKAFERYSAYC